MKIITKLQIRIKRKITQLLSYLIPFSIIVPIVILILDKLHYSIDTLLMNTILISSPILFLFSSITINLIREYIDIGEIEFSEDRIVINDKNSKKNYYVNELEIIKIFNYGGYKGKRLIFSMIDFSGDGNVLEFNFKGNSFKHYFKITSETQYNNWLKIINKWREINSNVKY